MLEVCISCDLRRRPGRPDGMMVIRVPAPASSPRLRVASCPSAKLTTIRAVPPMAAGERLQGDHVDRAAQLRRDPARGLPGAVIASGNLVA